MGWSDFEAKAKHLCPRFYTKRTEEGFEVWEKPLIRTPDEPGDYLVIRLPYKYLSMPGFSWSGMYETLKRMHENRLAKKQLQKIREMRKENEAVDAEKKAAFESELEGFSKYSRKAFLKMADEKGVTRASTKSNLDMSEDDAKREIHRQFDGG